MLLLGSSGATIVCEMPVAAGVVGGSKKNGAITLCRFGNPTPKGFGT
jgi:hypothetical protein